MKHVSVRVCPEHLEVIMNDLEREWDLVGSVMNVEITTEGECEICRVNEV